MPVNVAMFLIDETLTPLAHQLTTVLLMFNFSLAHTLNMIRPWTNQGSVHGMNNIHIPRSLCNNTTILIPRRNQSLDP